MGRPKKIDSLKQIDGKIDKQRPTTLEQLWGNKGDSVYGTLDEKVYEQKLLEMNLADLQVHAVGKGLLPKDDPKVLRQRLLNLFRAHVLKFTTPPAPRKPNPAKIKAALAVLAAGKS